MIEDQVTRRRASVDGALACVPGSVLRALPFLTHSVLIFPSYFLNQELGRRKWKGLAQGHAAGKWQARAQAARPRACTCSDTMMVEGSTHLVGAVQVGGDSLFSLYLVGRGSPG